jgi:hypothetical protein
LEPTRGMTATCWSLAVTQGSEEQR